MANFGPAYSIVNRNEGGYVNNPNDPGGETYRGIARNYHPYWEGWILIDFYKSNYGQIPTGAKLSQIYPPHIVIDTDMVPMFFEMLWMQSRADQINDQNVANIYFDFFVLHSQAVKAMQETLTRLGHPVTIDNIIGPQTLGAINRADSKKLHDAYKTTRAAYHGQRRNSEFYEGWIVRNNKFPTLSRGSKSVSAGGNTLFWVIGLGSLGAAAWLQSEHFSNRLKAGDYER